MERNGYDAYRPNQFSMSFLSQLNWRYATKKFDTKKKVSENDLSAVLEAVRMTPTSFGLESYKVVVVSDQKTKDALRDASYGQESVSSASHVIVLCARTDLFRVKNEKFERISGGDSEKRKGLGKFESIVRLVLLLKTLTCSVRTWSEKQTYIHLGFAMAACAELGIDSCALEGFSPRKYAKILGLPRNLKPTLSLPIGYRSSEDLIRPKSRSSMSEILIRK